MKYTVLSLFPEIIDAYFASSIMAKAVSRGIVEYRPVNIRDFALDKHKTCDDAPYGGGAGMLMLPEPLGRALESVGARQRLAESAAAGSAGRSSGRVIYLSPGGRPFTQDLAVELAREEALILLCGRYEGIDQRIIDTYVDDEISVGDYVLSSGEVAALALIDATYRLVDRVITAESLEEESFSGGLLEYPQYTRPEVYGMLRVPELLLSGHHENIRRWRLRKRVEKTLALRPDLIRRGEEIDLFDGETRKLIQELGGEG
ncbi:tRNA (guanosine(37)-N1)-methyltransferase TrmD [Treponema primitia]|uniref:tRNA (guanosine(37)-N1)-methyltransferase TrmD n=1 Tax=Treponema primitia TaxID=88058 RepID=UPI00025555AD|nr:tRNA (guanosine(37)-N1)-methyltransferase TrmD [Treponema primitia]